MTAGLVVDVQCCSILRSVTIGCEFVVSNVKDGHNELTG